VPFFPGSGGGSFFNSPIPATMAGSFYPTHVLPAEQSCRSRLRRTIVQGLCKPIVGRARNLAAAHGIEKPHGPLHRVFRNREAGQSARREGLNLPADREV